MALTSLISLINSSGDRLTIESTWCEHIRLVANMIEQLGLETTQPLEVPVADKADKRTLELIKDYFHLFIQNRNEEPEKIRILGGANGTDVVEIDAPQSMLMKWEHDFANRLDEDSLYNLMMAANFLDIPKLLDLCTTTVANMIRGRPADEMRDILGIECDLNEEELRQIEIENVWLAD